MIIGLFTINDCHIYYFHELQQRYQSQSFLFQFSSLYSPQGGEYLQYTWQGVPNYGALYCKPKKCTVQKITQHQNFLPQKYIHHLNTSILIYSIRLFTILHQQANESGLITTKVLHGDEQPILKKSKRSLDPKIPRVPPVMQTMSTPQGVHVTCTEHLQRKFGNI